MQKEVGKSGQKLSEGDRNENIGFTFEQDYLPTITLDTHGAEPERVHLKLLVEEVDRLPKVLVGSARVGSTGRRENVVCG